MSYIALTSSPYLPRVPRHWYLCSLGVPLSMPAHPNKPGLRSVSYTVRLRLSALLLLLPRLWLYLRECISPAKPSGRCMVWGVTWRVWLCQSNCSSHAVPALCQLYPVILSCTMMSASSLASKRLILIQRPVLLLQRILGVSFLRVYTSSPC